MTTPNLADNPPIPAGYQLMQQHDVTEPMTAWAVSILRDPATYPMFASVSEAFGALNVLARVEWHPPDFNNGVIHRGVTLFASKDPATVVVAKAEGLDVSGYQPVVDWTAARAAGKSFVFVKATQATTLLDHAFADHWARAKAAGFLRGAYHFLKPEEDAVAQAQFFLAQLTDRGELPPVLDVEVSDKLPLAQVAACVNSWVQFVGSKFARPIIYTSPGFWNLLQGTSDIAAHADLWVANWGSPEPAPVTGWNSWTFWQYTNVATISGIPGSADVDADRFNGSVADLAAYSQRFLASLAPSGPPTFNLATTLGVQQALNYLHVVTPPLDEDGILGPGTKTAVEAFQTSAEIGVDGVVGPNTITALQSALRRVR